MTQWLKLTDDQRRTSLAQASQASGINVKSIEKDWWVTVTLKALFQSAHAKHLIFKGGTSLSKCWKLIERFSEDIDIALDPNAFNTEYAPSPSNNYLKKLKRAGCEFTSTLLADSIVEQLIALGIPKEKFQLTVDPIKVEMPDKDPQVLFLKYTSLYDPNPYLPDEVKIEVGVRSKLEPFEPVAILSLLTEYFPSEAYPERPFEVTAVKPHKTFLEKAFLLHEEFAKLEKAKIRTERMSRHFYDLEKMMDTDIAKQALSDGSFYTELIVHRSRYSALRGIDYSKLEPHNINFYPTEDLIDAYLTDYKTMQEMMIYGKSLSGTELFERIKKLLAIFNGTKF